jgi:uncharacterized membrane protein
MDVQANLEASRVRAGGSLIVRVVCRNHGSTAVGPVRLSLASLPAGFVVSPAEQTISQLADRSDAQERLFTVHTPDSYVGSVSLGAVARLGDTTIESPGMSAEMLAPMRLALTATADKSTVQSGDSLHLTVHITNPGSTNVEAITAKIIDSAQHLDAPVQDVGDLGPGASRDIVFALQVPRDLPGDRASVLVVEAVSGDGTISQSDPLTVPVICRPQYEVLVQPLASGLRSGQSFEVTCLIRNASQCTARDLFAAVENLPPGFAAPVAQKIPELAPGAARQVVFSLLVPAEYIGEGTLEVAVTDGGGHSGRSEPTGLSVGALPTLSIIAFGLLVVLAVSMVVAGAVLYFRER